MLDACQYGLGRMYGVWNLSGIFFIPIIDEHCTLCVPFALHKLRLSLHMNVRMTDPMSGVCAWKRRSV